MCATSEVRSLKSIELLPCYLGTYSIGAPCCQFPWGHHAWEEVQIAFIVHTWDIWLSVSGESNLWVIVFQALGTYMKKPPASSTPLQPFKSALLGPKISLSKEYLSLQCPVQIPYCNIYRHIKIVNIHYKVWNGLSLSNE